MGNENETATATTQTEAGATSTEAPGTSLATAGGETGKQTQTTETQETQSTEKPAEGSETSTTGKTPETTVPEVYEFKAPEGMEFAPEVLETYSSAAKAAGLTQDAAQKVIEVMAPALAARQLEQVKALHNQWTEASKTDVEFGGEKLKENLGVARSALDAFGSPELKTLLDTTGFGNNPEVLRLLFKVGKAISEDKFVAGSKRINAAADPTSVLYDKTTQPAK